MQVDTTPYPRLPHWPAGGRASASASRSHALFAVPAGMTCHGSTRAAHGPRGCLNSRGTVPAQSCGAGGSIGRPLELYTYVARVSGGCCARRPGTASGLRHDGLAMKPCTVLARASPRASFHAQPTVAAPASRRWCESIMLSQPAHMPMP
ncbi:unnamed protein product [Urochloa humidicola]